MILEDNSNDNTTITKQTNEQIINTYEALMNSNAIKNVVEEKYGTVNNVEFKTIEDTDMMKVIYVCDGHTDEECKQI